MNMSLSSTESGVTSWGILNLSKRFASKSATDIDVSAALGECTPSYAVYPIYSVPSIIVRRGSSHPELPFLFPSFFLKSARGTYIGSLNRSSTRRPSFDMRAYQDRCVISAHSSVQEI